MWVIATAALRRGILMQDVSVLDLLLRGDNQTSCCSLGTAHDHTANGSFEVTLGSEARKQNLRLSGFTC